MIALENIALRQGSFELSDLSLELASGEYGVLMGRSGCGKTTLLEAVCGLRNIAGGRIILGGRDVTQLPPAERGVGYVPQDRALFPTMLVREQLAFALVLRALGQAEIAGRVDELAELLGITGLLDRTPDKLSGGEAQRVALGRALALYARPKSLAKVRDNGMRADFSWGQTTAEYEKLYTKIKKPAA